MIVRAYLSIGLENTTGTSTLMTYIVFSSWMSFFSIFMLFIPSIIKKTVITNEKKRREREDHFNEIKARPLVEGAAKPQDVGEYVDELFSTSENQLKITLTRIQAISWMFFLVFVCLFAKFLTGLSIHKSPLNSAIPSIVFLCLYLICDIWYYANVILRDQNYKYM